MGKLATAVAIALAIALAGCAAPGSTPGGKPIVSEKEKSSGYGFTEPTD